MEKSVIVSWRKYIVHSVHHCRQWGHEKLLPNFHLGYRICHPYGLFSLQFSLTRGESFRYMAWQKWQIRQLPKLYPQGIHPHSLITPGRNPHQFFSHTNSSLKAEFITGTKVCPDVLTFSLPHVKFIIHHHTCITVPHIPLCTWTCRKLPRTAHGTFDLLDSYGQPGLSTDWSTVIIVSAERRCHLGWTSMQMWIWHGVGASTGVYIQWCTLVKVVRGFQLSLQGSCCGDCNFKLT